MGKKVVITGALGLVGSHLVEGLLERGDLVIGVDNLKTGRRINLSPNTKAELYIEDIADADILLDIVDSFRPDVIIHCAASYADPSDWIGDATTNVLGSIKVAQAAKKVNARVIYFQTALCYGLNPNMNPIPIDHPRNPAPSSYAISKTCGELYLESSGVDLVTFRLANIVGPRNLSGALPIFFNRIANSQKCTIAEARRDFVDVRDVVPLVLKAVDGIGKGAYHISSGADVSILDLYNLVAGTFADANLLEPEIVPNPSLNAKSILLDPKKTIAEFGLINFRPLSETVAAAAEFYKEYGVSEERTHFHFKTK